MLPNASKQRQSSIAPASSNAICDSNLVSPLLRASRNMSIRPRTCSFFNLYPSDCQSTDLCQTLYKYVHAPTATNFPAASMTFRKNTGSSLRVICGNRSRFFSRNDRRYRQAQKPQGSKR